MLHEVGAAIHVQPNATRVLVSWDFDVKGARLVTSRSAFFCHGDSLKAFSEQHYNDTVQRYGAKFYLSHRVDLHNELKRLATKEDGPGRPADILLRKEVNDYVSLPLAWTLEDRSSRVFSIPMKVPWNCLMERH